MSFTDYGFEDFTVEREDWNLYKLTDGTFLKAKVTLNWVSKGATQGEYSFNLGNVQLVTMPPPNIRGNPSTEPKGQALQSHVTEEDIHCQTIHDNWSVYALKNGIKLNIRLVLVKVDRTSKFDNNGFPVYLVQSQVLTKTNIPKELREKGVKIASAEHPTFTV